MKNNVVNLSYPENGNEECFEIEDKSFWFRERNNIIRNVIRRGHLPGNFADVGGGNGFVIHGIAKKFSELNFILVEPGGAGCSNAIKRGISQIFNKKLSEISEIAKFENIGLFDVIEHIKDDKIFLEEIGGRLSPGGYVFLTTPAYNFLWSSEDEEAGHYRRYTKKSLSRLAKNAGLSVEFGSYFFMSLVPMIFLFRSLPAKFGKKKESKTDVHRPSFLSSLLVGALRLEEFFFRIGIRFPFGASIVMVLKKEHEHNVD